MNNNNVVLSSLSMDLKRIAIGFHRGSDAMAKRFIVEAYKRKEEVNTSAVAPYIKDLLEKMIISFKNEDKQKIAEDSLMYSTLFQNYCLKH